MSMHKPPTAVEKMVAAVLQERGLAWVYAIQDARKVLKALDKAALLLPTSADSFVHRVLDVVARADLREELYWNTSGEYAPLTFFINCSDVFCWGTADGEELSPQTLPDFEQAIAEVQRITGSANYASELYCARRRGMRPQGAAYPPDERLWPLFDACGPERPTGLGNPYRPGERRSLQATERRAT